MRSFRFVTVLGLGAVMLLAPALRAQEADDPDAPPPASNAPALPATAQHETEKLQVNVDLVDVFFSVRDKNGYVTGLTQKDCQLAEDNKPQTLQRLTQEKNLPLTIGILLDTSGSQANVLPLEQESAARFLREVLTPKDEAFLISFDVNVDLLADYTNSAAELKRAIDAVSVNTASSSSGLPGMGGGPFPVARPRGTLLYDAVYLAAQKLQSQAGRKVIVLLTDGQDEGSQTKVKQAIEAAQKANAIVYPILIADQGFYAAQGAVYMGSSAMNELAAQTGGRVINVGNNGRKLEQAFDQIQDELRAQYLASYSPVNKTADGKFRKIEIACGEGMKVQARKGYYAIAGDTAGE